MASGPPRETWPPPCTCLLTNEDSILYKEITMSDDDTYTTKGKTTTAAIENEARVEANQDPITSETASHPVGTGVGALGGAAAGAAARVAGGGAAGALIRAALGGVA